MFGGSSNSSGSKIESDSKAEAKSPSPGSSPDPNNPGSAKPVLSQLNRVDERGGFASPPARTDAAASSNEKKRRGSSVGSRASNFLASAKNTLNFSQGSRGNADLSSQTPLQKLGKQDPALAVPQGQHNNSAGESAPGPRSTFRVGVWEDRNKRCRRTMEDTHAFLYNFLATPPPASGDLPPKPKQDKAGAETLDKEVVESDNGYFAIFDGHAGTFAADWCGKKLHLLLEDTIRKNPAAPIPELLDMTFTAVDAQLEKLPLKNSGCTAAIALLRWENRTPASALDPRSAHVGLTKPASQPTEVNAAEKEKKATTSPGRGSSSVSSSTDAVQTKRRTSTMRQRILYTANVGDARIILCRGGRALRLSYDHKGSDELEGKRVTNAGGLILNNRVNGVLAVTRALGDAYMKELVTGHPYTTETVIQPDVDEFLIIACDGLWDVCSDQEAVDLVRKIQDPVTASRKLVDHALDRFSTDNLSCMIVRFENAAAAGQAKSESERAAGSTESATSSTKVSEAEKIVSDTRQKIAEGMASPLGISASNSGRGYDTLPADGGQLVVTTTTLDEAVEEELEASGKDEVVEVTATQGQGQDEDVSEATLTISSDKGEKGAQE